ncbi:alkaline phosphatase [Clostridium bowmanii]|uniref:alkaline phosphatase n=1 Tax=Clostridium bowmanii TaxID=132925 RepID=UPI001C0C085D|nr:alkaline phosphatase [Clostridium bowmanii]MBU3188306.1 alkaline phosphatase [Clostridium bowmanii]MCA1072694.1 alkaline phosphatase [Clostridium bowmanii]
MLKFRMKITALTCTAIIVSQFSVGLLQPIMGFSNIVSAKEVTQIKKAKNVIMMIPDGCSVETVTLARLYYDLKKDGIAGNDTLNMDSILTGLVQTHWQDGPITDSAPGGTAYSIGFKTEDKHIGTLSTKDGNIPKATVLEAAREAGKATGIVVTCEATHATPADYASHSANRSQYNSIMKQMVYGDFDVVLGGGDSLLSSEAMSSDGKTQYRKDGIDLKKELVAMGYEYVTNKTQLNSTKTSKFWGMFAPQAMSPDIDRERLTPEEPTIEEMTNKAIDTLSKDKDGFFLMVEGSQIDWAGHANDPTQIVSETVAYDKAVKSAVDFAKKDGNTVVISASDHGCGGGTLGVVGLGVVGLGVVGLGVVGLGENIGKNYSSVTFEDTVIKLVNAKASSGLIGTELKGKDEATIKSTVKEYFDIENLTKEQITEFQAGNLKSVISKIVGIGWSTNNHTAGDVGLYCYAPAGIEKITGLVDNIDVAAYIEKVAGFDLSSMTDKLFKNAKNEFEKFGATVSVDTNDLDNPVINISKSGHTLKLNGFTDNGVFDTTKVKFDDISILITKDAKTYNAEDIYVPSEVITKFEAYVKAGKVVDIKPIVKPIVKPVVKPVVKPSHIKAGFVTAKSCLKVRSSNNLNSSKLGLLKYNYSVKIIGEVGDWYKICYGKSSGIYL